MRNVTILVDFRNSLGQPVNYSSSSTTPLKSISQILASDSPISSNSGTGQGGGPSLLELAIIFTIVLVAAGVGIIAAVKRRNNKKMGKSPFLSNPVRTPIVS